jgi:hypothetical protein
VFAVSENKTEIKPADRAGNNFVKPGLFIYKINHGETPSQHKNEII